MLLSRPLRARHVLVLGLFLAAGSTDCADVVGIRTTRYLVAPAERPCQGTLHVRVLYDMTGNTRDVGVTAGKGVVDHLRSLDAAGGIRGCPIELDVADTAYDVSVTLAAYQRWAAQPHWAEVSTIFAQGTPMTQAIGPLAVRDAKLVVTTAFNGELAAPIPTTRNVDVPSLSNGFAAATLPVTKTSPGYPVLFFQATDYTTSARIAMSYVWKSGAKRVGFFACTKSAFCTDPVDGAKSFLRDLGGIEPGRDLAIELDDDEATIQQKTTQYFDEERAHGAADPTYAPVDWIWFGNTRATLAMLGRALATVKASQGMAPNVITDNWGLDEQLIDDCGAPCIGYYGVQPYPAFGDLSVAGMSNLLAVHADGRSRDGDPPTAHAAASYVYGYVAVAAWRAAVEAVLDTGAPIRADTLTHAFESFHGLSLDGLATLSYSSADHRPQSTARVYVLAADGRLTPIGQPAAIALRPEWLGW
jgi:hypothetical protein